MAWLLAQAEGLEVEREGEVILGFVLVALGEGCGEVSIVSMG